MPTGFIKEPAFVFVKDGNAERFSVACAGVEVDPIAVVCCPFDRCVPMHDEFRVGCRVIVKGLTDPDQIIFRLLCKGHIRANACMYKRDIRCFMHRL